MTNILYVFLMSLLPIVELRGSIILGASLGVQPLVCAPVSIVGNLLPVPFILLLFPWLLQLMKKIPFLRRFAAWLEERVTKKTEKMSRQAALGLFLFVAIPIPGTGAWTGSMIASVLHIRKKYALFAIVAGVITAAVIMTLASYGLVGFLNFLL